MLVRYDLHVLKMKSKRYWNLHTRVPSSFFKA